MLSGKKSGKSIEIEKQTGGCQKLEEERMGRDCLMDAVSFLGWWKVLGNR